MSPPLGSIIISPVASILGSVSKLNRKYSVFDFSILIGVNNPSNLKNYFKEYQEQYLTPFFDSDFSYYFSN